MSSLFIKNVNILNPYSAEAITGSNILIKNKKIVAIGENSSNLSENTKIIDGEDNYLLPGFIDSHCHIMANGFHKEDTMVNPLAMHFYNALANMKSTIDAGVTTIRDCGLADIGVKMAQEKKLFSSPKMDISVKPLAITGGHFDFHLNSGFDMELAYPGFPIGTCDGVVNVLKKTREVIRARADFIKVMASGGILSTYTSPHYSQFNKKELKTIVDEANVNNLKVAAHCHSLEGINNCIDAGISSIEHGTFIDKNTALKMKENNMCLIPTLVVHHTLIKEGFPLWDNFANDKIKKLKEVVKVQKENIANAYELGVNMLMGSDCGVISHGNNLKELSYLVKIGMDPIEAIASATIKPAKYLGKENDIGSITNGKIADLVLVKENPLDNINCLANCDNILMTIQDGEILKNTL